MKKILTTFSALALLLALCTAAQAYSLTWDNYTAGGVTVTASGGSLVTKTNAGYGSLGVSGGVNGEISIGQSITFAFDHAQTVTSLCLSLLYTEGNYGDVGDEWAQVTAYSGGVATSYILKADAAEVASWDGLGTVNNLSDATYGNGALWELINPFGDLAVDSIVLTALDNGVAGNLGSQNSDFGFYSMETTHAPIPGAAWLLGTGLLGLVGLRRKLR